MSIIKELLQKSEHYSGYERQTAVTALAPYAEAAVLEVLLRRANDWVPQVRSAAKQSLRHQLQGPQGFVLFYQHLPDCFALERSPRESHQMLLQEIIHHLGLQAVERRLYTSICKDQPRLAQWSWISALTHKILPSNVLLELGLEHPYAALRHVALKLWKAQAPEYQRLLALMHLKCRFSAVRENALRTLLSQSQPIPHRHTMIWDTSPWIRLNILPTLDPQAVITAYNYALHHPLNNTRLKIALWGMGHLKCPQAKSQIMIYAQQNKSLSVKRAALQAIMQGYLSGTP